MIAAVRPPQSAWVPPWGPRRWAVRLIHTTMGLYGLIVAIAAAGAVLNGRAGTNGGLDFLFLLPAVAGLAVAPSRPLDGWLLVTGWLVVLRFVLPAATMHVLVLEPWGWLLWIPVLLLAEWAARGRAVLGVPLVSASALLVLAAVTPGTLQPHSLLPALVLTAMPLALGAALGSRQSARAALRAQQARADDALARQGALAERARIAREMHDVVAHSMSMIAVRAETAPYRLGELPDGVRAEFADVAAAARQSLGEMQNLLGVLRADDAGDRAPQPGLDDLGALLERSRSAGTDVEWQIETPDVPPALGLTAYRIVQQGLANAAEHAPGAPVRVNVVLDGGALRVVVVNGAPGQRPVRPDADPVGRGAGIHGMRERAAVHGGEVVAGPTPDGGFALTATLPIPEATGG